MKVKQKIISSYNVSLKCDNCGETVTTYEYLTCYPPIYRYKCQCGWTHDSRCLYPYQELELEEIE